MKCYKLRVLGTTDLFMATNRSDIWQTAGGAKRAMHDAYIKNGPPWYEELRYEDRKEYKERGAELVCYEMVEVK